MPLCDLAGRQLLEKPHSNRVGERRGQLAQRSLERLDQFSALGRVELWLRGFRKLSANAAPRLGAPSSQAGTVARHDEQPPPLARDLRLGVERRKRRTL